VKQEWFDRINKECERRVRYACSQIDAARLPCSCAERSEWLLKAASELLKAAHDYRLMSRNKVTP
jgi:hypothetical protein